MLAEISDELRSQYARNGFVAVPRLLDDDELEMWRTVVDAAVEARRGPPGTAAYQRVFHQHMNLWRTSEAVRRLLVDDTRVAGLAAELAGVTGLRVWHDQALLKPPFGSPTTFHMDVPFWPFTTTDAISVWIALDDATVENGCLWYVPGSHTLARTTAISVEDGIGALFEHDADLLCAPPVPAPVPAGGAVFHNGLAVHGAGANMTARWRRAMTCAFMPDGATFNGREHGAIPRAVRARLEPGMVLDDDAAFPLVSGSIETRSG